jgi:micrococcal nuclease
MGRRRQKTTVALVLAIILMLLGYLTRDATRTPQKSGLQLPAGVYAVAEVKDGDSLTLTNGAEVRLVGIDTPEKGSPLADKARQFARELLEGRTIRLVPAEEPMDKFKRNLAYIFVESEDAEMLFNVEIVKAGYAYAWPYKPNFEHREEISAAQKEAQAARRGLWSRPAKKLKNYVVTTSAKYSLTHRTSCRKLKQSALPKKTFKDRLEALNHKGGAPPCRECKP